MYHLGGALSRKDERMRPVRPEDLTLGRPAPLLPRRLRIGSVFGVVAPASPFERNVLERGMRALREMGFEVRFSGDLFDSCGYLAGSDEHRAAAFNRLVADPKIDAIMCARGGYGSLRILPLLDYSRVAEQPKAVIGFSDVTALLWALYSRCGLISFHGPLVTTLADAAEADRRALWDAVAAEGPLRLRFEAAVPIRPGRACAPVAGGNLTTLCHLLGTAYAPAFRDYIVFLEDRGEALYRIDRMLTQMKMAGCFDGMQGLVLGSFKGCGAREDVWRVVTDVFADAQWPILAGVDAGHCGPNVTIPLGVEAVLDADNRTLVFERATVD
jgi:muramoyltetrapeptide carboxypeptidase